MMKRKIKNVTRMASQLTDAKPEFVSLVGHGANQTPFRTVKAAQAVADFRGVTIQEDTKMAKKKKQQVTEMPAQAELQKVSFASAQFDTAEKVTEYLEAKGYSEFTVTKSDDGFEVIAKEEKDFDGDIKTLDVDAGVTMYVGKLAAGAEPILTEAEKTAEIAVKAAEIKQAVIWYGEMTAEAITKKYCDYGCNTYVPPQGKTVADVLTEQYSSGQFPAYWDLSNAFATALFNLVKNGETAGVKALTEEYGTMIVAILTALTSAGVDVTAKAAFIATSEKETKMDKEKEAGAGAAVEAEVKKTQGGEGENQEPAAPAETPPAAEPAAEPAPAAPEAEPETKKAEPAAEKPAAPVNEIALIVAAAMKEAVTPLTEAIAGVQSSVAEIKKETSEGLAEMREQVSKAGERVGELENSRQARKSAEVTGVVLGSRETAAEDTKDEETKKAAAFDSRMQRNLLGIG